MIQVSDEAFSYLRIQRGTISQYDDDRRDWDQRYYLSLLNDFTSIIDWLPSVSPCRVLDVGGGLSGISVMLNQHYDGALSVRVIDGVGDPPRLIFHRETYNSGRAGCRFLEANGVCDVDYWHPDALPEGPGSFDLVLSTASWCFHYPPSKYLKFVLDSCKPDTVLVVDVRKDRKDWFEELDRWLAMVDYWPWTDKITRCRYRVR